MKYCNKFIIFILSLLLSQGCTQDDGEEGTKTLSDGNSGKREVSLAGVSNFGRVRVGASMNTEVRIKNPTSSSFSINLSGITTDSTQDFYVVSDPCSPSIQPGKNCKITLRFEPVSNGFKSIDFQVNSSSYTLTGEGIPIGDFYISPAIWSVGDISAGDGVTEIFTVFNEGANSIPAPVLDDSRFYVVTDNCDNNIPPANSCEYTIRYNETVTGPKNFILDFKSLGVGDYPVTVIADVSPGPPAGLIKFDNVPEYISVDDTEPTTVDVILVPDAFGNPVVDGTLVTSTLTNGTHSGSGDFTTVNGQGQLSFNSTSQSGDVTLSVFAGEAVGVVTIPARPGPADGTIGLLNFNNNIRADGFSQITLQTQEITDANGNPIANGDEVFSWIETGDTNAGTISPSITQSFNGRASFNYTAGTSAQDITLGFGANPQRDAGGNITGYGAEGYANLTLFPNIPSGDFNISCNDTNVFYLPETASDYLDCEVGPITDVSDNLVGEGIDIDVTLLNAQAAPFGSNVNNFTIQTEADSIARFTMFGVGARGYATIDASNGSERVTHQVFMVGEQKKSYASGGGGVDFYFKKAPSNFNPATPGSLSPSSSWNLYSANKSPLNNLNYSGIGFTTYAKDAEVVLNDMPYMTWDCFKLSGFGAYMHPCGVLLEEEGQLFSGSSKPFFMAPQGDQGFFKVTNIEKDLALTTAHGTSDIIFPLAAYDKESGEVVISGGADKEENLIEKHELVKISKTSSYGFPLSVKTKFSDMSYFDQNSIASDFMYSVSDTGENAYVFGGLDPTNLEPVEGLKVLVYDDSVPVGDNRFSLNDVTIEGEEEDRPLPRYDNGIHYNKAENTLYVFGGWAKDEATENWYALRDIWKINLDTFEWVEVCSLCSIPENPSPHVAGYLNSIGGSFDTSMGYINLFDMIGAPKIYHDPDLNKDIMKYQNDSSVYEVDLAAGTSSINTNPLLDFIEDADSFAINPLTGKRFAYRRGTLAGEDSELRFLDSQRGQKQYYKVKISLKENAKQFFRDANILVSGLGMSKTYSGSPFINDEVDFGMSVYIFNHDTGEYDFLGSNAVNFEPNTFNDYMNLSIGNPRYISSSDEITLILTPSSNTGYQFGEVAGAPSPGESRVFLNYVELTGRY